MNLYQAGKKWDVSTQQIKIWMRQRKVPAVRVMSGKRMVYDIPDDFPMPVLSAPASSVPSERTQKAVLRKGGKRGYIAKYAGTFSIRHMARFLETTPAEIRAIYDDIVANGGF